MKPAAFIHRFREFSSGRGLQDESGQTLIELALLIPAFLALVFGAITFSMVLCSYESATFACKAAARYACLHSSTSLSPAATADITTVVQAHLWAPPNSSVIGVAWSAGNTIGSTVTVSVTTTYSVGIPFSTLSVVNYKTSAQMTVMR